MAADTSNRKRNATDLELELNWLARLLDARFRTYFGEGQTEADLRNLPPPDLSQSESVYAGVVNHYRMSFAERVVLILALTPHLRPQLLDIFFSKNAKFDRGFAEFGGIKGQNHGGFLPTGETANFVLSGNDLLRRFEVMEVLNAEHYFFTYKILATQEVERGEPALSTPLTVTPEYLAFFTSGQNYRPPFSHAFPAARLETQLDWSDLVLDKAVMDEIMDINAWLEGGSAKLKEWGLYKRIKPGYRSLFYGPPGTGKTLTVSLLGKSNQRDVYRVDLSRVISKYIGETEKNLANVFDQAQNKDWILFFDEADALFGKRSATKDAHDRYANQEVSYLLQRIEDFPGLVILATNLKSNIDDAFARRFQSMVYFPMPGAEQRQKLWKSAFSEKTPLEEAINFSTLAEEFEISGGAILNVVQYCSLQALRRGNAGITLRDIRTGIRREFLKEGKTGS